MVRIAIFMMILNLCSWAVELTDVSYQELYCTDPSRNRQIPYLILYPCDLTVHSKKSYGCFLAEEADLTDPQEKRPLVLYSHHHRGCYWDSLWLGYFLAQHGYIFVSIDHPGNTYYNQDVADNYFSYWNRPEDVSFVLTDVLNGSFGKNIEADDITMAGFSMGGLTTLWLAGAVANPDLFRALLVNRLPRDIPPAIRSQIQSLSSDELGGFYKDRRFCRYIALAPGFGEAFPEIGLQLIDKPVLCITSTGDTITPAQENADHYATHSKRAHSISMISSAGHYVFINEGSEKQRQDSPKIYGDTPPLERIDIQETTQQIILLFLKGKSL